MIAFATRAFEAYDAELYVDLAATAFQLAPRNARPTHTAQLVAHLHGDANPAGRALVTLAFQDARPVGHVSALPFRFRRRDGTSVIGWQVGCFAVDASLQRQGVGRGLIAAISAELARRGTDFVYTYPNPRSSGVFRKHGYASAGRSPTWLACPAPLRTRYASRVTAKDGTVWDAELLDASGVRAALATQRDPEPRCAAFVRDRAYFRWRTLHAEADARYRFALLKQRATGETIAVALGAHRFSGLTFTILVDAWPDVLDSHLELCVRAAGALGRGRLVYWNTNRPMRGVALSARVPRARDPRPVELLLLPGGALDANELALAPTITADWLGF
jgi:predicted N-acetyltransferase YhbS